MKALLLIPLLLIPYLLFVRFKYGMTKSISDTYRFTQRWEKVWFTVSMFLTGIPLMIVGFEYSNPEHVLILWLLAGGGICLVGVAPMFWKGGMEYKMHMIGAIGGISCGMVALLARCFSIYTLLIVGLFIAFAASQLVDKWKINNKTYWVEVAAIVTAQLALYFT